MKDSNEDTVEAVPIALRIGFPLGRVRHITDPIFSSDDTVAADNQEVGARSPEAKPMGFFHFFDINRSLVKGNEGK